MTSLLETKEVTKDFGGLRAVNGCSIVAERGSICGLIGPNGAGKTTLFDLITGFYKPTAGTIWFKGERIDGLGDVSSDFDAWGNCTFMLDW